MNLFWTGSSSLEVPDWNSCRIWFCYENMIHWHSSVTVQKWSVTTSWAAWSLICAKSWLNRPILYASSWRRQQVIKWNTRMWEPLLFYIETTSSPKLPFLYCCITTKSPRNLNFWNPMFSFFSIFRPAVCYF